MDKPEKKIILYEERGSNSFLENTAYNEACDEWEDYHNFKMKELSRELSKQIRGEIKMELSKERIKELEKAEVKLNALERGGVDSWDGYDFALEEYNKLCRVQIPAYQSAPKSNRKGNDDNGKIG